VQAALNNNLAAVGLLLSAGANVHHRNNLGHTVLHAAVRADSTELTAVLIDAGAELDGRIQSGLSALHMASTPFSIECTKWGWECEAELARFVCVHSSKRGYKVKPTAGQVSDQCF
jgi:ankyrin repeat protein